VVAVKFSFIKDIIKNYYITKKPWQYYCSTTMYCQNWRGKFLRTEDNKVLFTFVHKSQ